MIERIRELGRRDCTGDGLCARAAAGTRRRPRHRRRRSPTPSSSCPSVTGLAIAAGAAALAGAASLPPHAAETITSAITTPRFRIRSISVLPSQPPQVARTFRSAECRSTENRKLKSKVPRYLSPPRVVRNFRSARMPSLHYRKAQLRPIARRARSRRQQADRASSRACRAIRGGAPYRASCTAASRRPRTLSPPAAARFAAAR